MLHFRKKLQIKLQPPSLCSCCQSLYKEVPGIIFQPMDRDAQTTLNCAATFSFAEQSEQLECSKIIWCSMNQSDCANLDSSFAWKWSNWEPGWKFLLQKQPSFCLPGTYFQFPEKAVSPVWKPFSWIKLLLFLNPRFGILVDIRLIAVNFCWCFQKTALHHTKFIFNFESPIPTLDSSFAWKWKKWGMKILSL